MPQAGDGPPRRTRHATRAVVACGLSLIAAAMVAPPALATPAQDISSSGPLTDVWIGNELSCQFAHVGDGAHEFYPPSTVPGDCGTLVVSDGQLYAPDFANHGVTAAPDDLGPYTPYTPVSQTGVTGAGTGANPYRLTTVVDLGAAGLRATEVDRYVVGDENYRTDVTLTNRSGATHSILLYHVGDCYLHDSDAGYGFAGGPACVRELGPVGRMEEIASLTPGNQSFEGPSVTGWDYIAAQLNLPGACFPLGCEQIVPNGVGVNWEAVLAPGASATFSMLTGDVALPTSETADSSTAPPGGSDGYTIRIDNPRGAQIRLRSITDILPPGFTYQAGSTSGATTADPIVSGQKLRWPGPFILFATTSATLHFRVATASAPGTYLSYAGGRTRDLAVTPSGWTAPVTIAGPGTDTG